MYDLMTGAHEREPRRNGKSKDSCRYLGTLSGFSQSSGHVTLHPDNGGVPSVEFGGQGQVFGQFWKFQKTI